MSYTHPDITAIAVLLRNERITTKTIALEAGIERNRLAAVLNGITEREMQGLRAALRARGVKLPK